MNGTRTRSTKYPGLQTKVISTILAGIALVLTGCAEDAATVPLPASSGSQLPTPSSSAQADAEAIKDAYRRFVAILQRAESIPANTRKKQLQRYMVDPQLSKVLKVAKQHQIEGVMMYGWVAPNIKAVHINGPKATVQDCQNAKNSGLKNKSTHEKINRGFKERNIEANLRKGDDGHWRVSKYVAIGECC